MDSIKKVKGSSVKLMVKAAKGNWSEIYEEILTDEAKKLLGHRILDATWYPYEVYRNIHDAVVLVDGKKNPKILHQWGYKYGEVIMTTIYKNTIVDTSIEKIIDKFRIFFKLTYNWGHIKMNKISDTKVIISYEDFERDWEYFYYIANGWMLRFLELCLNKSISYELIEKSWEGADSTKIMFSWNV
ncbi:MAG: hypothetical protein ACFFDH_19370 [Promethearchaeota archaeon]